MINKLLALGLILLGTSVSSFAVGPISGGGLTSIKAGNIIYVDAVNGTGSGSRGRGDRPFSTCAAAKTAASAGDTIVVRPGAYTETNLLKNGVNWYFENGVTVTNTSTSTYIFDDWTSGANANVTCSITGRAAFVSTGTNLGTLLARQLSSNIYIEGLSATSVTSTIVSRGTSTVIVKIPTITSTGTVANSAVWWYDGSMFVTADTISGSGPAVVYSTSPNGGGAGGGISGLFWVQAKKIENTSATLTTGFKAVWCQDNEPTARVWIDSQQIKGPVAVQTSNAGGANGLDYVRAEKIFGQVSHNDGNLYLDAQKLSDGGLVSNLLVQTGGSGWFNIGQVDDAGLGTVTAMSFTGGTSYLSFASFIRGTAGTAISVAGGDVTLGHGRITTQGGSSDLVQTSGTLRPAGVAYDPTKTSGAITPGMSAPSYIDAPNGQVFLSPGVSLDMTQAANTTAVIFTVPTGRNYVCLGGLYRFTAVGASSGGSCKITDASLVGLANTFSISSTPSVGTTVSPTGITTVGGGAHVVTAGNTVNASVVTQATGGAQTVMAYSWGFYY